MTGALPPLEKPRFTSTHIVRWMAAQQNWDKIHFDQWFCDHVAKVKAPVINGALKQHWIMQFLNQGIPGGWPWRVDYQFVGQDHVNDKLRLEGDVSNVREFGGRIFVSVGVEIVNTDRDEVTMRGSAVVVLNASGEPMLDALDIEPPDGMRLPLNANPPDPKTPAHINARLNTNVGRKKSCYPVDLSRLRLFADAVMGLPPLHYEPAAGAVSVWGAVVAPPLFSLHGLEAMPDSLPLGEDPTAQGREGVNEVGRDLGTLFDISPAGGMNAGNRVEVHSLLKAGETIHADSTLVGAKLRSGKRGGEMIFLETLNRYTEARGRALVTERQTIVIRLV